MPPRHRGPARTKEDPVSLKRTLFSRILWQDVCKFLAGAFFVNAGVLFYLWLARVSVPILGTRFTATPEISGLRSIVHFILFLTFFYLGFIRKWKGRSID